MESINSGIKTRYAIILLLLLSSCGVPDNIPVIKKDDFSMNNLSINQSVSDLNQTIIPEPSSFLPSWGWLSDLKEFSKDVLSSLLGEDWAGILLLLIALAVIYLIVDSFWKGFGIIVVIIILIYTLKKFLGT